MLGLGRADHHQPDRGHNSPLDAGLQAAAQLAAAADDARIEDLVEQDVETLTAELDARAAEGELRLGRLDVRERRRESGSSGEREHH